jgi:diadenosine tetraphosphate (Ap4A) HIT family hydrolase
MQAVLEYIFRMGFNIDERLIADCHVLQELDDMSLLLHNNADVLWFILVPHTDVVEFYQLSMQQQQNLCTQINRISELINNNFQFDKLNVATIGNVVSQMHIHIVARRKEDPYWPGVVWGQPVHHQHDEAFIERVSNLVKSA